MQMGEGEFCVGGREKKEGDWGADGNLFVSEYMACFGGEGELGADGNFGRHGPPSHKLGNAPAN